MPDHFSVKQTTLSAPSRLHFGLLSIGNESTRKFGGAGLMIDGPRNEVSVAPSERLSVHANDDIQHTILKAVRAWHSSFAAPRLKELDLEELPFEISANSVERHSGLGSGTQLAFATAAALSVASHGSLPGSEELALATGRGRRSAIGSYGFSRGGFLVDRGVRSEQIAPLDMRLEFPSEWKIALVSPRLPERQSMFGEAELAAFRSLPATPEEETRFLSDLLQMTIAPSILAKDFSSFAEATTTFGYRSGKFYETIQGGAYASPEANRIVRRIKEIGEFAVGQSSWGPTLFAIGPSEKQTNWLVENLLEDDEDTVRDAFVVSADNVGAKVNLV